MDPNGSMDHWLGTPDIQAPIATWFGHVCRMDPDRQTRQAMDWTPSNFKRRKGRPRVSWTSSIKKDLELLGVTLEEALDLTGDRSEWRNCTARCATIQHVEGLRSKVRPIATACCVMSSLLYIGLWSCLTAATLPCNALTE